MKNSKVLKGILVFLGGSLIGLGLWRTIDPVAFFAFNEIILPNEVGQLNEARGTGGAVFGFGVLILLGAFKKGLTFTSLLSATILFFGFATARILGFVIDGNPLDQQIQGTVAEIINGALALFCLVRYKV